MCQGVDAGLRVYRVGGCVRDGLLGLPAGERDWVVLGETPEKMLARGFKQVGAAFPVFIHPQTGEEYALARTEAKSGKGYKGFRVDFSADISLEEDLHRRDLTINAMATDEDGRIIDPFGGQKDLERRRLRAVSSAFGEDPLRVLRVARFAARFAHLGFSVDPGTLTLMSDLVRSQELMELSVERIWQESFKALATPSPAEYFRVLDRCGALEAIFPELAALKGKIHSPVYHPEGDAWAHTLLTLEHAVELTSDVEIRFAALTHDIGKGATPMEELPHHYGHEKRGVILIDALCERMRVPRRMTHLARLVVAHHMRCHRVLEMRPGKVVALLEVLNAFRNPAGVDPFLLACAADTKTGIGYPAGDVLRSCLQACLAIDPRPLINAGYVGVKLGEALRQERIRRVKQVLVAVRPLGAKFKQLSGSVPSFAMVDGVAWQRSLRDEWS
ncbi:MAG: multifunctional CCA addition/repair protein [Magnetococcales bacterium]|nr:multifunctional CCA addition/repair protein [Magnetococcales bacterium]